MHLSKVEIAVRPRKKTTISAIQTRNTHVLLLLASFVILIVIPLVTAVFFQYIVTVVKMEPLYDVTTESFAQMEMKMEVTNFIIL